MKKLTLVSVYANGRRYSLFVQAVFQNGKAIVSEKLIEKMLFRIGVIERGMTYSIS
jgi:hypothetical protein